MKYGMSREMAGKALRYPSSPMISSAIHDTEAPESCRNNGCLSSNLCGHMRDKGYLEHVQCYGTAKSNQVEFPNSPPE